jgi:hypothetical protein
VAEQGEYRQFLTELFADPFPDELLASLWERSTRTSFYLPAPVEALDFEGREDIYVAAALVDRERGPHVRLKARDAAAIPGVWADVDMPGPEDPATKRAAPDREAALEVINAVFEPTLLVSSGYGVQAWWLFEEPWVFGGEPEREQAERVLRGWQTIVRQECERRGFGLDATHDLARLMRLPGMLNGKGPTGVTAPVTLDEHEGARYSMETLSERALAASPPSASSSRARVSPDAAFPMQKFEALKDNSEMFRRTWEHSRRDRDASAWSTSEYDQSLASQAANAGWTDDQVAALVTTHRQKYNGDADEKSTRLDYLERTVGKAKAGMKRQEREELADHALEELAAMGDDEAVGDPGKVMAHFNAAISGGEGGAPRFKDLLQFGRDPDTARYVLVQEDGSEVVVGPYENLREPRRLDRRLGPATSFVMQTTKDSVEWRDALRKVLRAAQIREPDEPVIVEWVRRYIYDRLGSPRDEAAKHREPFEENELIFVQATPFARFVRSILRERVSTADLAPRFKEAGFEARKIHYTKESGQRTSTSYWCIGKAEVE